MIPLTQPLFGPNNQPPKKNSESKGCLEAVLLSAFLLVLAVCCTIWGAKFGDQSMKYKAVEAGVAEWRCDKEGRVSFHWLPPAERVTSTQ